MLRSPRAQSHPMITGIAKKDRKKTACPGGTCSDVALTSDAMTTNVITDINLKPIPLSGDILLPFVLPVFARGQMKEVQRIAAMRNRKGFE